MDRTVATIFGGAGFIGKYLVSACLNSGYYVKVVSRKAKIEKKNFSFSKLGQCSFVNCDIKNREQVFEVIKGSNIVINLIGLLESQKKNSFSDVHVKGVSHLCEACEKESVKKLIHVSAIGVENKSTSKYFDTKLQAEKLIKKMNNYMILRPSVVYGDEDKFINFFAKVAKLSPVLPLIGGGLTKFQPIWVRDLADLILLIIKSDKSRKILEVGGAEILSFKEILAFILAELDLKKKLIKIPFSLAQKMALFSEILPMSLLTRDQVEMLKFDNIVNPKLDICRELDFTPNSFDLTVAKQLQKFKKDGGHL